MDTWLEEDISQEEIDLLVKSGKDVLIIKY